MKIGTGRADAEERENVHKGQQKEVQLCMEMNAYDPCTQSLRCKGVSLKPFLLKKRKKKEN